MFFLSLFLAWCKVRDVTNVIDDGISTGWSEAGYLAVLPLVFILAGVLRNKQLTVRAVLASTAVSFLLLIYNNVVSRTIWESHSQCVDGECEAGHNFGSDLGSGFWIGLFAITAIAICGLARALHDLPANDAVGAEPPL